jgi:hypothetical protein
MSVTKPTPKVPPLDDALAAVLLLVVALLLAAGALLEVAVLLELLLPHAASPRASAPVAIATRLRSLILPINCVSFPKDRNGQP